MARAVRCKTEAPRPTNVRAATMYQASNVEHLLRAIMGIRAHPRLTSGKTSLGHHGTQSLGCAGQTVRPSLHSISQTSVGKLSILNYFWPSKPRDKAEQPKQALQSRVILIVHFIFVVQIDSAA